MTDEIERLRARVSELEYAIESCMNDTQARIANAERQTVLARFDAAEAWPILIGIGSGIFAHYQHGISVFWSWVIGGALTIIVSSIQSDMKRRELAKLREGRSWRDYWKPR